MKSTEKLIHRENYLLTRDYLEYLRTKRKKPNTITRYSFWLRHLLIWAMDAPFEQANKIPTGFADYVDGLNLSQESRKKIVETSRAMLRWAKTRHEEQFAQLPYYWIEDLTPVKSQQSVISNYVTLDEIQKIAAMNIDRSNLALWRDQAMACMLYLSGARAKAATTLPIKAVHLHGQYPHIEQYPEYGVQTKNDKSAKTFLHNIPELLQVVQEWDTFARDHFPKDHPWYSPIHQMWGEQTSQILVPGENRSNALGKRLHHLADLAGLNSKSPHKYRHGYAMYGLERCTTIAEYHNLSRNLMHSSIAITDKIYVHFEEQERGKILAGLQGNPIGQPDNDLLGILGTSEIKDYEQLKSLIVSLAAQLVKK